jgi:cytoskeletal protein CcmA (bactofilin family)
MHRPSVIPEGMRLSGDVEGEGDLVVLGMIEGDVRVDGALVVEESGVIKGQAQARTIVVRGVLGGDGTATDTVRVEPGARMVGDARAPRVSIVDGALFRGRIEMSSDAAPRVGRAARRRTAAGEVSAPSVSGQVSAPSVSGQVAAPSVSGPVAAPSVSEPVAAPSVSGQVAAPTDVGRTAPGTASSAGAEAAPIAGPVVVEPGPVAPRRGPPAPRVPALRRTEARRVER